MTTEDNNETMSRRHRVSTTARRVKRTLTAPLHRKPRPSLPTPAAPAFVGLDGRSYWLLQHGASVALLIDEPGRRPEVFDVEVSLDDEHRLEATVNRAGDKAPDASAAEPEDNVAPAPPAAEPVNDDAVSTASRAGDKAPDASAAEPEDDVAPAAPAAEPDNDDAVSTDAA